MTLDAVKLLPALSLYWRVCVINALMFLVATAILVLSPATVSVEVTTSELVLLTVGLTVVVLVNSLLLRSTLAPLDRVIKLMEQVDLERPGQRLSPAGGGVLGHLVDSFNAMLIQAGARAGPQQRRGLPLGRPSGIASPGNCTMRSGKG